MKDKLEILFLENSFLLLLPSDRFIEPPGSPACWPYLEICLFLSSSGAWLIIKPSEYFAYWLYEEGMEKQNKAMLQVLEKILINVSAMSVGAAFFEKEG